ncbi:hypothetical protein [Lacipirellula limnantheis]|uniref:Lipoprotein n=1 Tax=Lacipirellula limnantheis TaxID=2528024 RepID=A0A517U0G8_9BACT|nr:hypothetical protein [Lacipirellula limnantheis]QDT74128.1 hypothetical protein I41_33230 [Lacipirellula limnantheis]
MSKLLFVGALILLVSGCRDEAGGAKVSFVETRLDESQSPLPFVIALANSGIAATDVEGVGIEVVESVVLPGADNTAGGDGLGVVKTGDFRIEMREGHPTAIPARGDGVACGFVRWDRLQDSAAAAAAVSARFRVTLADGATIVTPSRVLLLASDAGGVGAMIDGLSLDRDEAAKLLARVEALPGERTDNVDRLLKRLRVLAK